MAIHCILIERDQQIEAVTHVRDFLGTGTNGEKGVATANDGLIGVVGIEVQAAAAENLGEDVARCSDTLTGGAPNADGKCLPHSAISRLEPTDPAEPECPVLLAAYQFSCSSECGVRRSMNPLFRHPRRISIHPNFAFRT